MTEEIILFLFSFAIPAILIIWTVIRYTARVVRLFSLANLLLGALAKENKLVCILLAIVFLLQIFSAIYIYPTNLFIKIVSLIVVLVLFYIISCLFVLSVNKIHSVLMLIKNEKISRDAITIFYVTASSVIHLSFVENPNKIIICFIALFSFISYMLTIKALYSALNKNYIFLDKDSHRISVKEARYYVPSIISISATLFVLLILNVATIVCCLSRISCAYNVGSLSFLNAIYYTAISFTTIGYGDIFPVHFASQLLSVMISMTSIFTISIYIATFIGVISNLNQQKPR